MKLYRRSGSWKVLLLGCVSAVCIGVLSKQAAGDAALTYRAVPQASCGSTDRPESVQGETTMAERFAPGPAKAYNCNLELVSQVEADGASIMMDSYDNCVFYGVTPTPLVQHFGTPVVDVSDSKHPVVSAYMVSPALVYPNESFSVSKSRKLLVANGYTDYQFDVYDLSHDCRSPVLLRGGISIPHMFSHSGVFSPDGERLYTTSCCAGMGPPETPPSAVFAIDMSDSSNPRGIATWISPKKEWQTHSISVSDDGNRVYVTFADIWDDQAKSPDVSGMAVLDTSDFQARRPNPQFRLVGTLFWNEGHMTEYTLPMTIKGRPYLVVNDLQGSIGQSFPPLAPACVAGKPGHGYARIVDISDEKNPRTVGRMALAVDLPENCEKVKGDPAISYKYSSVQCAVDNDKEAKKVACGYHEGGLRVFDVRDPSNPREIAYYKPPARRTQTRPSVPITTNLTTTNIMTLKYLGARDDAKKDHTADQVATPVFRKNGTEVWFISYDNGFQVVRFSDRLMNEQKDLF